MNSKRITTGIIFLFIGSVLLLDRTDVIDFNWFEVFRFWPLLIILFGVNMLVPKNQVGYIVSMGATFVILAAFTFIGISTPNQSFLSHIINESDIHVNIDTDEDFSAASQRVFIENSSEIQTATAHIDLGATQLKLLSATDNHLFEAENSSEKYFLSLNSEKVNNHELTINLKGKTKNTKDAKGNLTTLKLNKNLIWDLNYDLGAADVENDLSLFKIRNLSVDAGASNLDLKLGSPLTNSTINIDAGASSIHIAIPKDAACQIHAEMALSSMEADESFIKGEEKGVFTTANYEQANKKFTINIDGGVSSINITRY